MSESNLQSWRAHVLNTANYDLEVKVKPFELDHTWLESRDAAIDPKWDDSWMDGSAALSYPKMKAVWEERACKVVVCGDYMREERDKHAVYTRRKLFDSYEHLKTVSIKYKPNGEGVMSRSSFIKAWVQDEHLRTYKYLDTYPPPLVCPSHTYNCWRGFAAGKYEVPAGMEVSTDSEGVRAFVNHLHVLLSHDTASTDYVLSWIAQILQQPSHKTGIALLLKGGEGVGKNRFTDLLKLMLGEGLFMETASPEHVLFGRFTDARLGKFLIVVNEASGSENHAANDNLKDMITLETFVWEAKGRDGVQMRAYDRFIFTTNNSNVLKINPDSRRYIVFEVSGELKGNTSYFKELSRHISDEHARYEFYMLLMSKDLSRVDWINDRPLTSYYNRMVEHNLPREWEYLKEMVIIPAYASGDEEVEISSAELFEGFVRWLSRTTVGDTSRGYATTATKFGSRLGELVSGSEAMKGVSKHLRRGYRSYSFEVETMVSSMVTSKWVHASDLPLRGCCFAAEES